MNDGSELLLVGTVALVGVLHTMVPDHWVPITLIARQRGWSKADTARASLRAGTGHVLSTLLIALVVWFAGVAVAARFGHLIGIFGSQLLDPEHECVHWRNSVPYVNMALNCDLVYAEYHERPRPRRAR